MTVNWPTAKLLTSVVILLLGAGTLHRWAHLSRASVASTPRELRSSLTEIPDRIGAYTLRRDLPLTAEVLQVADVDQYVHREYVAAEANRSMLLYVGYWGYENIGTGHGPDVCYPAAGWETMEPAMERAVRFHDASGAETDAVMDIHHFVQTEPGGPQRIAVGFVAIVNGEFRASSRGKYVHVPPRGGGFLAQVQVSTVVAGGAWNKADTELVTFMETVLPAVSECLFGAAIAPGGQAEEGRRGGDT